MIYDVRHVTTYTYGSPVTFAQCTLRLLPQSGQGQSVVSSALTIDPQPSSLAEHTSFFGPRVVMAQIEAPHTTLTVDVRSVVDVNRTVIPPDKSGMKWETVRTQAYADRSLKPDSPAHFLYPSQRAALWPIVTTYVGECFPPGRPVIAGARDITRRIRREFKYDPDATKVSTPLIEAFKGRHGVCQDYAHIMIAGLRGLGLPAAYVSGYIRTIQPEGKPRLEGSDASHAWVALWCGPEDGWIGFDPTNDMLASDDHIEIGRGRDYGDVAPLGGILQGAADQDVEVAVDVIPRL